MSPCHRLPCRPGVPGEAGFTLLELLVAMAIFAVIGAMALGGLNAIVEQQSRARKQMDRLAHVQRAVRLLTNDLGSVQPRLVRDELGDVREQSLTTDGRGAFLLRLTRGGWSNPAFVPYRGTLQRVQYRLDDDVLVREYWPVLDHTLGAKPRSEKLLDGVKSIKFLFYDDTVSTGDPWISQWPPLNKGGTGENRRPPAIRVVLDLADWGEIERIVEVVP